MDHFSLVFVLFVIKTNGLRIMVLVIGFGRFLFSLVYNEVLTRCLVAKKTMNATGKGSLMQRAHDLHVCTRTYVGHSHVTF